MSEHSLVEALREAHRGLQALDLVTPVRDERAVRVAFFPLRVDELALLVRLLDAADQHSGGSE